MNSNRVLSGKTTANDTTNKGGSLTPFNYNTSIIDLNFDRMREIRTSTATEASFSLSGGAVYYDLSNPYDSYNWQNDRGGGGGVSSSSRNDLANFRLRRTADAPPRGRKFLITKNFRFYEPVKDAEMMAEFQNLR